jgi:type II secretion system protein N
MTTATATLRPRLLYGAFALAAFAFALRATFPAEAVRERLIYEAGARGWQVEVERVRPGALLGVRLDGIAFTDPSGVKVGVERLDASLRILPLLLGRRVLAFQAAFLDGTVKGTTDLSGDARHLLLELKDLDLARALPLRQAAGRDLAGRVAGTADLTLPGGAIEKASGRIALKVTQASAGAGGVAIPGMAGSLPLPAVSFGTAETSARLDQGRAAVEKLEAKGGDVELSADGVMVVLQPRLEYAPISGRAHLKFSPSLWQKPSGASLRPLAEATLASSRGPDGTYLLQLSGSLGHPQLRAGGAAPPPPPPPAASQPTPPAAPPPPRPPPQGDME